MSAARRYVRLQASAQRRVTAPRPRGARCGVTGYRPSKMGAAGERASGREAPRSAPEAALAGLGQQAVSAARPRGSGRSRRVARLQRMNLLGDRRAFVIAARSQGREELGWPCRRRPRLCGARVPWRAVRGLAWPCPGHSALPGPARAAPSPRGARRAGSGAWIRL